MKEIAWIIVSALLWSGVVAKPKVDDAYYDDEEDIGSAYKFSGSGAAGDSFSGSNSIPASPVVIASAALVPDADQSSKWADNVPSEAAGAAADPAFIAPSVIEASAPTLATEVASAFSAGGSEADDSSISTNVDKRAIPGGVDSEFLDENSLSDQGVEVEERRMMTSKRDSNLPDTDSSAIPNPVATVPANLNSGAAERRDARGAAEPPGAGLKTKRIIFGTSLTANRVRRKFPLVFCELERDNGIVCPGVRRGNFMDQFYYDALANRCQHFVYNGCGGNGNRFSSLWECNMSCTKKQTGILNL